jgi:hypothetical protein
VVKVIRRIMGRRPSAGVPRHRRDRREVPTHPWFVLREQRTLELGQYR